MAAATCGPSRRVSTPHSPPSPPSSSPLCLKALSSLQATVTNFAANFISSGLAGCFLFDEPLPSKWFAGASLIIFGVFILSKSSIEEKQNSD
uniref:EamA domain-containing protein n=1 Tax=Zea mays TaxID=4577 RepID=A0A804RB61_MAIZE